MGCILRGARAMAHTQCDVKFGRPAFPDSDYIQMFIPVDMDEPKLDTDKFKAHLSAPLLLRFNWAKTKS